MEENVKYTKKDFVKAKSYTLNKTLFAKAVGVLLKVLLRSIHTESDSWTARVTAIVEVRENKISNQYATITISTNPLLEDHTTILDPNEMAVEDSAVFQAMKLKAGVF